MTKVLLGCLLLGLIATLAFNCVPNMIAQAKGQVLLTSIEKARGIQFAAHTAEIQHQREKAQAEFNATMNRLAEEDNQVTTERNAWITKVQQDHELDTTVRYRLEPFQGVLVKISQ